MMMMMIRFHQYRCGLTIFFRMCVYIVMYNLITVTVLVIFHLK